MTLVRKGGLGEKIGKNTTGKNLSETETEVEVSL